MSGVLPDIVIAALIIVCAVSVVYLASLRRGVLFFLGFCVLMAVAWVRLGLPTLGAAELAIGALMTGYVLWRALWLLPGLPGPDATLLKTKPFGNHPAGLFISFCGGLLFMGLAGFAALQFLQEFPWTRYDWYGASGIPVAGAGFFALSYYADLLRRVFAFNVLGSGIFLLIICFAGKSGISMAIPVFMVTMALVVAFFASLLVVILLGRKPTTGHPEVPGGKNAF